MRYGLNVDCTAVAYTLHYIVLPLASYSRGFLEVSGSNLGPETFSSDQTFTTG